MKKLTSIILTVLMCLSLTACDFLTLGDNKEIALVNKISAETIQSVVTILNTRRTTIASETEQLQGSGVIVKVIDTTAYVMTNYHVIEGEVFLQTFKVIDYKGVEYPAKLFKKSVEDDLSIISFTNEKSLPEIKLASVNESKEDDKIIALGAPYGQRNCITLGKVLKLDIVSVSTEGLTKPINITYPVINHTAPIDHGSSGGALLNYNTELVGINFAGSNDKDGKFSAAYAIPLEKVKAFMVKSNLLTVPEAPPEAPPEAA